MKFGALPDGVMYALVLAGADFDMDTTEKLTVGQRLRSHTIPETPGDIARHVQSVCEDVRKERTA
jgi:hypothetical protein